MIYDGVTNDEYRPRAPRWPVRAAPPRIRGLRRHRRRFLMVGAPPPIICRRAAESLLVCVIDVTFSMCCMISLLIVVNTGGDLGDWGTRASVSPIIRELLLLDARQSTK